MYSSSSLLLVLAASIALCNVDAWTATSSASSFGGRSLVTSSSASQVVIVQNGSNMEMKKGKPNVPPQMRGNYKRQKQMADMQSQMRENSTPGSDGFPVFNLYVRSPTQKLWYPCGSFKGDERSAALSKSYSEGGLLSGISKKQLDGGIAGSLYSDLKKLKGNIVRTYPQLRKSEDVMEFGYKLKYKGLPEDKAKEIIPIEPKESTGPLDGIKNIFS